MFKLVAAAAEGRRCRCFARALPSTATPPARSSSPPPPRRSPSSRRRPPSLGSVVTGADRMPAVDGFRLKPGTKVGLWRAASNMPGGWLMWLLEQYGINHEVVKAQDFDGRSQRQVRRHPAARRARRRRASSTGSIAKRNDPAEWSWAYGVGDAGWTKLKAFVQNGGTLLAIGSAVETATRAAGPADREGAARSAAPVRARDGGDPRADARRPRWTARCATPSAARRA